MEHSEAQHPRYVMALDQGTSSSRAIIYAVEPAPEASHRIRPLAIVQHEIDTHYPADGWVEQDPEVLWQTTLHSGRAAIAEAGLSGTDIAAIGITNQRETTLVWERATGECVYPAIVWQDRRTAAECDVLRRASIGGEHATAFIAATTGLVIDPYFSSTKLAWILNHVDGAKARAEAGELCFGTVDTYLVWRLTQGAAHLTDATNASRTQLFDIHEQRWSNELLEHLSIPNRVMPTVVDSAGQLAQAHTEWFGAEIPICGIAGDQQAALVGQGCLTAGMSKSTYGTGCFVMTNTGAKAPRSTQQLLTTVAYRVGGQTTYALEGSIFVAGVAIKWLRDQLGLIAQAEETEAAFRRTEGDSGGVVVVPAFTGLGAPHWKPDVRGMITGLTLDSTRDQLITAFLQAVGYQTQELLQAMAGDGAVVHELRVDGGMVVNDAVCQFLADILDVDVQRPVDTETTALGAALLAAVGAGLFPSVEAAAGAWASERRFVSGMPPATRQRLLDGYRAAVRQVVS